MDIEKLSTIELIESYSKIINELKSRNVIRTKNLLGDLAEYLVIDFFQNNPNLPNLQTAPAGTKNIDAISRLGYRYSIKATSGKVTGSFWGLNPPNSQLNEAQKFEYLIVACFDNNFKLKEIIQCDWSTFIENKKWNKTMRSWQINITNKFKLDSDILFQA